MANLTEKEVWENGIYLIEKTDRVIGGVGGISNKQAEQLANRTQYLRRQMSTIVSEIEPRLLPVGGIIQWGSTTLPTGWIEANGQAFDKTKNPELAKVFPSGRVPDLRGRFVRGWAHGSAVDPDAGRAILSTQEDAIQNITGTIVNGVFDNAVATGAFSVEPNGIAGKGGSGQLKKTAIFDASRVVRTSTETRAKNIALMYIVKTDQADDVAPDPTPTNIIVTPSSLQIGVGGTQQFTAQVLPADLASKFPITWLSTDTTVGTISSSGLFTAKSAGTTEIIASVSSGLSVNVTVQVEILLTSIALAAIPDQKTGDTYQLVVTKTPANATEPLEFTSTNNAVASVSNTGELIAASAGTATIRVGGSISSAATSRSVTVLDAPRDDDYLIVGNRLSEFKTLGAEAQAEARANLGIGGAGGSDIYEVIDSAIDANDYTNDVIKLLVTNNESENLPFNVSYPLYFWNLPTDDKEYCKQFAAPVGKSELYTRDYVKNATIPTEGQDFRRLTFYKSDDNSTISFVGIRVQASASGLSAVQLTGDGGTLETQVISATKIRVLFSTQVNPDYDDCVLKWDNGDTAGTIVGSSGSITGVFSTSEYSTWVVNALLTNESSALFAIEVEWLDSTNVFTPWIAASGSSLTKEAVWQALGLDNTVREALERKAIASAGSGYQFVLQSTMDNSRNTQVNLQNGRFSVYNTSAGVNPVWGFDSSGRMSVGTIPAANVESAFFVAQSYNASRMLDSSDSDSEITAYEAENIKRAMLLELTTLIDTLSDIVEDASATESDVARLSELKQLRKSVYKLDTSTAPNIVFPILSM